MQALCQLKVKLFQILGQILICVQIVVPHGHCNSNDFCTQSLLRTNIPTWVIFLMIIAILGGWHLYEKQVFCLKDTIPLKKRSIK